MPDLPMLLSFVVAAFVVVIVPGITVSAIVSVTLAHGMASGFWTELGVQFGRLSMVLIVAVALEAVLGLVSGERTTEIPRLTHPLSPWGREASLAVRQQSVVAAERGVHIIKSA